MSSDVSHPAAAPAHDWAHDPVHSTMLAHAATDIFAAGRPRLQTLILLRWLAVGGQAAAVLFTALVLNFDLPLVACLATIAASAWLNIILALLQPTPRRASEREAIAYLAYDIIQLAILLYLTGGLGNPFALLFLVPVTISATTLSLRATIGLASLALAAITFLGPFHLPLPWFAGDTVELPSLWVVGMWAALVLGVSFMAAYAFRVAREGRRMAAALSATQLVLAREQRLSAIDGLAAAAAHELGTPLSTISLVANELRRDAAATVDPALRDDLALLHSQAERCRDILATLRRRAEEGDDVHERMPLAVLLDEAATPFRDRGRAIVIELSPDSQARSGEPPDFVRRIEILYALRNLIENAVAFSRTRITISARWWADAVEIAIADDGPGFPAEIIDQLGEPYVSSRRPHPGSQNGHSSRQTGGREASEREGGGLGLGFFIAKTLVERTGARLTAVNRPRGTPGAIVRLIWPRRVVEAPPQGR